MLGRPRTARELIGVMADLEERDPGAQPLPSILAASLQVAVNVRRVTRVTGTNGSWRNFIRRATGNSRLSG